MLLWAPQTAASSAGWMAQNQHLLSQLEEPPGLTAVARGTRASDVRLMLHLWIVALGELWALWGLMWQWPLRSDKFRFILRNSIPRSQVLKANRHEHFCFLNWNQKIITLSFLYWKKSRWFDKKDKVWRERGLNNHFTVNKWWIKTLSKVLWGIELISYWLVRGSVAI